MFIRITESANKKTTKVYLVEGYRDKDLKVKQRIVKCYGELDELRKENPNIIQELKIEAKKMTQNNYLSLNLDMSASNEQATKSLNYGYFILNRVYDSLGITEFCKKISRKYAFKYNIDEILRLLTFSRILKPASKLETVNNQDMFFNQPFDVKTDDVYRSLEVLNDIKEDLQLSLHKQAVASYGRDNSLVFYDVTNYYFETEVSSELKKIGVSKEKRKTPIVQMGLLIDTNGIPISYKLYSGNTHDSKTLIPIVKEMREKYGFGKIIVTADRGINNCNNLAYLASKGDGYVISQKIRATKKEFIDLVLDEEGYTYNAAKTFKIKDYIREREVKYEEKDDEGAIVSTVDVTLKEKVIIFWSQDFDAREKHKREKLDETLKEFQEHPSKYNASNSFGAKKYLKLKHIDKETGEVQKIKPTLDFNQEKYDRDVALDGYYCIITSETELSNTEVIEKYRGLWRIEESFKVIKSDLEGRPVYVRNDTRIEGHFLICYLALMISRILEFNLKKKYTVNQIQESLLNAKCKLVEKNIYALEPKDKVLKELETIYNIELDYKYVPYEKLKKYKK